MIGEKISIIANITKMLKIGVAIRRIFGSDWDSDSYKNPFKKNPDFPRISDSWNFRGLRIFGFGLLILAIILYVFFKIKYLY